MMPNNIQKWLSYFTEIHIESVTSDYNKELEVLLNNGRYQLCTPNAVYSYADKYSNFGDSFLQLNLDTPVIRNVLLLGFGLGSIPYMLEKKFAKKYSYTGVEIDEAVIYLASKYVLDDLVSDIELVQADAYAFVCQNQTKYDLICIDIFIDDKIPDIFLSTDFLSTAAANLSETGFIMFNHLAHLKTDILHSDTYYKDVFSTYFPKGTYIQVRKNRMMISDASRLK